MNISTSSLKPFAIAVLAARLNGHTLSDIEYLNRWIHDCQYRHPSHQFNVALFNSSGDLLSLHELRDVSIDPDEEACDRMIASADRAGWGTPKFLGVYHVDPQTQDGVMLVPDHDCAAELSYWLSVIGTTITHYWWFDAANLDAAARSFYDTPASRNRSALLPFFASGKPNLISDGVLLLRTSSRRPPKP